MTQLNQDRYKRLTLPFYAGRSDGLYLDTTTNKLVMVLNDAAYALSGQLLVSNGTDLVPVTPSGDVTMDSAGAMAIGAAKVTNAMQAKPRLRVVREQLLASQLVDGGAAVGTKALSTVIPAGARVAACLVDNIIGFAGDVSASLKVGDGTTADRYMTGTPSVFTTAAQGVDMGAVSGTAWHTAAKTLTATVTSAADITPVLAGGGSCFITIIFYEPI